jgi:hypothetical protein
MVDTEAVITVVDFFQPTSRKHFVELAKFKRDLTMWICISRQVFLVVEEPLFHEMIADLSMEAAEMIPSSNTIHGWIVKEFKRQRSFLIEKFTQS